MTDDQRDKLLLLMAKAIATMWHPCDGRTRAQSPERAVWEEVAFIQGWAGERGVEGR